MNRYTRLKRERVVEESNPCIISHLNGTGFFIPLQKLISSIHRYRKPKTVRLSAFSRRLYYIRILYFRITMPQPSRFSKDLFRSTHSFLRKHGKKERIAMKTKRCQSTRTRMGLIFLVIISVFLILFNVFMLIQVNQESFQLDAELPRAAPVITYFVYSTRWKEETAFVSRIRAIADTWGKEVVISSKSSTVTYLVPPRFSDQMTEQSSYGISSWLQTPDKYKDAPLLFVLEDVQKKQVEYEWIYLASDASYVIPTNLELLLTNLDASEAYYLGHPLHLPTNGKYSWNHLDNLVINSVAGIVLSRRAVELVVEKMADGCIERCINCPEDLYLAFCLREANVFAKDTRDAKEEDRFHVFQPGALMDNTREDYFDYTPANCEWYQRYSMWNINMNLQCCSAQSISFHYLDAPEIYALHSVLTEARSFIFLKQQNDGQYYSDALGRNALQQVLKQQPFKGYTVDSNTAVRRFLLHKLQIHHKDETFTAVSIPNVIPVDILHNSTQIAIIRNSSALEINANT